MSNFEFKKITPENKNKIILFFFEMRQNLYFYHLTTLKYSRHVGVGKLVDSLDTLIDTFLETFFGRYGRPKINLKSMDDKDVSLELKLKSFDDNSIIFEVNTILSYLYNLIPFLLSPDDTDLLNIRDEIVGLFNRNKYLFELN